MTSAPAFKSYLEQAMRLHQSGDLDRAMQMYRDVLAQDPRQADALHLLGGAHWQKGNLDEAERLMREAINVWDADPGYYCDLAGVLLAKGKPGDAAVTYHQALQLDPSNLKARDGLANAFGQLGYAYAKEYRWEEAEKAYLRLLEIRPEELAAYNNLGEIYQHAGNRQKAYELYTKAVIAHPGFLLARYNRAICNLGLEKLSEGWADLEASSEAWLQIIDKRRHLPWMNLPLWDGSNLQGKKILVWGDQGIGDEILFASMVPDLIAQGAHVTIECMDRLVPLFERSFPEATVITRVSEPNTGDDFDFHAPGLWLGRWLRQSFSDFPGKSGYLKADADVTKRLRQRYEAQGKKKIIGISWHSSSEGRASHRRMTLMEMVKFLPREDVLYVNLQYGDRTDETTAVQRAAPDFNLFTDNEVDQLKDMDVFAAQVAACDKIVSIGNTTAHVAGALGIAGDVLLPLAGLTWFWFENKQTCPWYPQLRLLRKVTEGDWTAALEQIVL